MLLLETANILNKKLGILNISYCHINYFTNSVYNFEMRMKTVFRNQVDCHISFIKDILLYDEKLLSITVAHENHLKSRLETNSRMHNWHTESVPSPHHAECVLYWAKIIAWQRICMFLIRRMTLHSWRLVCSRLRPVSADKSSSAELYVLKFNAKVGSVHVLLDWCPATKGTLQNSRLSAGILNDNSIIKWSGPCHPRKRSQDTLHQQTISHQYEGFYPNAGRRATFLMTTLSVTK